MIQRLVRTPLALNVTLGTSIAIDYPFAKYNVQATPYVYSQEEYSRLLEGACMLHASSSVQF